MCPEYRVTYVSGRTPIRATVYGISTIGQATRLSSGVQWGCSVPAALGLFPPPPPLRSSLRSFCPPQGPILACDVALSDVLQRCSQTIDVEIRQAIADVPVGREVRRSAAGATPDPERSSAEPDIPGGIALAEGLGWCDTVSHTLPSQTSRRLSRACFSRTRRTLSRARRRAGGMRGRYTALHIAAPGNWCLEIRGVRLAQMTRCLRRARLRSRRSRLAGFLAQSFALAMLVACGGSSPAAPTPPAPPPGPLVSGRYALLVSASTLGDPSACDGPVAAFGFFGAGVLGHANVAQEGTAWLARSPDPKSGTIEMRLTATGAGELVRANGVIQGRLEHLLNELPGGTGRRVHATIPPNTPVTGSIVNSQGTYAFHGKLDGPVEFTDGNGSSVRCRNGHVDLSGPVPVLPP